MSTDTGVWAYAVIHADSAEARVAGLSGVDGEAVRLVAGVGLAASVGTVRLVEFGQDALRRNLEDLDWLAAKARAHDAVISAIARSGPVVPVRMTTVYFDDERVRQVLESRQGDFLAALDRVCGRQELGVKAYADAKVLAGLDESASEHAGEQRSGTAYLLRRRRELSAHEEAHRTAAAAAERIHATLLQHAVDGKRKPVSDSAVSGSTGWTVLNGTYLVEDDNADDFRAAVVAIDRDIAGIELEVTGPWPPYSFTADVASQ